MKSWCYQRKLLGRVRLLSVALWALLAIGAAQRLCRVHKERMVAKKVPVIFMVCRHNQDEWQQYTNARARLFPNSCDEIVRDMDEVTSTREWKKSGWKSVRTNVTIQVCARCDGEKAKWIAAHPPRKPEPGEVP